VLLGANVSPGGMVQRLLELSRGQRCRLTGPGMGPLRSRGGWRYLGGGGDRCGMLFGVASVRAASSASMILIDVKATEVSKVSPDIPGPGCRPSQGPRSPPGHALRGRGLGGLDGGGFRGVGFDGLGLVQGLRGRDHRSPDRGGFRQGGLGRGLCGGPWPVSRVCR
jgi:hypothetical protein